MKEMNTCYQELLSLTQLFLLREFPLPRKSSFLPSRKEEEKSPPPPLLSTLSSTKPSSPQAPLVLPLSPPSPSLTPQAKKEGSKEKGKKWELEPLTAPPSPLEIEEFWTAFPTLFPHLSLSPSIPDDSESGKMKHHGSKEQEIAILILSFGEEEKSLAFLKKMAQGISERLAPARVLLLSQVKKEEDWQPIVASPSLRLIIACDYALYTHPELMRHYLELPEQRKHFLFNKPLLLLSDPHVYLREPKLKTLLWKTICHEFASTGASL